MDLNNWHKQNYKNLPKLISKIILSYIKGNLDKWYRVRFLEDLNDIHFQINYQRRLHSFYDRKKWDQLRLTALDYVYDWTRDNKCPEMVRNILLSWIEKQYIGFSYDIFKKYINIAKKLIKR